MGLYINCTASDISLKIRYVYIYKGTFGEVPPVSSGEYSHRGECVYTEVPSEYFWHRRCTSGSQWTWSSTWAAEIRGRHFPPPISLLFFFMKHCGTTIRHCGSNEKTRALVETEGRQRHLSPDFAMLSKLLAVWHSAPVKGNLRVKAPQKHLKSGNVYLQLQPLRNAGWCKKIKIRLKQVNILIFKRGKEEKQDLFKMKI